MSGHYLILALVWAVLGSYAPEIMAKSIEIDPAYFARYAGSRKAYNRVWRDHTYADELIAQFKAPGAPRIKRVAVMGAATGKILPLLEKGLGARVWGCEISPWAHQQIPLAFRRRIRCEKMQSYLSRAVQAKKVFDLVYSNSLIYLTKKELGPVLKDLAHVGKIVHFNSSFKGKSCPDPYRKILETYDWWNAKFCRAGFQELRGPRGHRTYLWVSKRLA